MILRRLLIIAILLTTTIWSQAQQINAVPDYVFRNQMSVGRNAVTDTAAYFSIGPRYGATKGFMPPIVGDTATFSSGKRNGLLIFSVQKNKFLYWDSVRVQWSDMAGSSGSYITGSGILGYLPQFSGTTTLDTSALYTLGSRLGIGTTQFAYNSTSTANIELNNTAGGIIGFKRNDSARGYLWHTGDNMELANTSAGSISFNTNSATRGSISSAGVWRLNNLAGTGDRVVVASSNGTLSAASSATGLVDTLTISTRAWRQKGLDSLAALEVSGSGTTNYVPKFTAASTIGNSQIFDNGTNVGIGTASPSTLLTISKTGAGTIGPNLRLHNTSARQTGNSARISFAPNSDYTGTTTAAYIDVIDTEGIPANPSAMAFGVGAGGSPTERLRITSGGDVGIGTASPAVKLDVTGSGVVGRYTSTSNAVPISIYNTGTSISTIGFKGSTSTNDFNVRVGADANDYIAYTNNTERMRIFANGRIGVNTTTDAGYQFDVNGTGRFAGALRAQGTIHATNNNDNNSGDFTGMVIGSSSGGTARTASFIKNTSSPYDFTIRTQDNTATTTGSMIFLNGATETMRITSSGNVGIGTASPAGKLVVVGANANTYLSIDNAGSGENYYASNSFQQWQTAGSARMTLNSAGELLINTTSDAGDYKLQVSGNIYNTGSAVLAATSGNVGVGTAPSAWTWKALQNGSFSMANVSNVGFLTANAFWDGAYKYINTGAAQALEINNGNEFRFLTAASGTSGTAITFTQAMTLNAASELLVNTTSDAGDYKLQVSGNAYATGGLTLTGTGSVFTRNTANTSGFDIGLLGGSSVADAYIYQRANAAIIFGTNNAERGRINSAGEWIIDASGTDAGDYKLQVVGNARVGTGKLDISTNTVYGLGVARTGTSEVAGQVFNSNGILYFGAESSTGGGIFSGSSAYAGVIGSGANYPLQFATNNTTRATITNDGILLINTTTPVGNYKLQINGDMSASGLIYAVGTNATISAASMTNIEGLSVVSQSITGSNDKSAIFASTTWNTTGNPNALDISIVNTASGTSSNYLRISDGTNSFRVTKDAGIITGNPSSGTAAKWRLGSRQAGEVELDTTQFIEVEIGGTFYRLAIVTPL